MSDVNPPEQGGYTPPPPPTFGDPTPPPAAAPAPAPSYGAAPVPAAPAYGTPQAYGGAPAAYAAPGAGPIGQVRSTGVCILLAIVTFGIYSIFWFYKVHEEMKRHSGQGIGGAVALLLTIFIGVVTPFLTSSEVGGLYERAGREKKVSGATGLWYFPGAFILVGPLVWFVKTNGALNDYWMSLGAS